MRAALIALIVAVLVATIAAVVASERDPAGEGGGRARPDGEENPPEHTDAGPEGSGAGELLGGAGSELLGGDRSDLLRCLGLDDLLGGDPSKLLGDPSANDPVSPEALVKTIARRIERVRHLRFKHRVVANFLRDRALEGRIGRLFASDYSAREAHFEGRVLAALGAVPSGTDLRSVRKRALEGQVAGFYVPKSGRLFVRAGSDIGALEKVTLAHELEHALADQRLGLEDGDGPSGSNKDADLASLAVAEGDATLTMQRYALRFLSIEQQLSMATASPDLIDSQQQLEALPHFLQRELLFPYVDGLGFVCRVFTERGFRGVDRLYAKPPTSTDQILFPVRYLAGERPRRVVPPDDPGHGYERSVTTTIGAAELQWLFEAPGGDTAAALEDPRAAASLWAGGLMRLFTDHGKSALGISLLQRSARGDLCGAVVEWYRAAWPGTERESSGATEALVTTGQSQAAVVACSDNAVHIGIGPDTATARALVP